MRLLQPRDIGMALRRPSAGATPRTPDLDWVPGPTGRQTDGKMRRISGWQLGCLPGICVARRPHRAGHGRGPAAGHDPATDVLALADVVWVMRAGEIQYEAAEQPRSAQR
jgi:hypothetical protein